MTTLFGHGVRSEGVALYLFEAAACFAIAYAVLLLDAAPGALDASAAAATAAVLALLTGLAAGATGMYDPEGLTRAHRLVIGACLTGAILTPVAWAAVRLLPGAPEGLAERPLTIGFSLALAGVGTTVATRLLFILLARAGLFASRIAVHGPVNLPAGRGTQPPFNVVLRLPTAAAQVTESTLQALRARRAREVVAADPANVPPAARATLQAAGLRVTGEVEFVERHLRRVDLASLPANWLDGARAMRELVVERALRRTFDIVLSLALVIFTLPLTALAALAIRLDSPGPVFYRQERVGRGGRVFRLYKLRSMRADAEAAGTPQWAVQRDPRVTRVGRLLRLTRVDEIPQVLNVLRGDMAFIGPRPERPAFVEKLARAIPHYADRAVVRPGITGWAQVSFPYGASEEDSRHKLTYDLYYVRHRSLFLDLLILVATVRVVLFQEGSR